MLQEKAMLVNLHIQQWTARKYDKKASKEVAEKHGAGDHQEVGRFNKILVAKDAINRITRVATAARNFHYENTLPWSDAGARILPAENFAAYSAKMREFKAKFDEETRTFVDAYPHLVEDARQRLNGLFNEQDYPSPDQVSAKFQFNISISPIPSANDFRVSLTDEDVAKIRRQIEARMEKVQHEAVMDLWHRLFEMVNNMVKRLSKTREDGKPPIFRASLISNMRNFADLLQRLNFTNDPKLEEMRQAVIAKLCLHTPREIRESSEIRQAVVKDAKEILDSISRITNPQDPQTEPVPPLECPAGHGPMKLTRYTRTTMFRDVPIRHEAEKFMCPRCGLEAATPEQTAQIQKAMAEAYRKSTGQLPAPENMTPNDEEKSDSIEAESSPADKEEEVNAITNLMSAYMGG